ncbi:hypothetical protein [Amycolatopsis sp. NPDC051071]|uniref:hypothetical protein n=1 Tax=Amycolatopsis sp. NPDC051071 TaxID=3154637 RepID=UPI0034437E63
MLAGTAGDAIEAVKAVGTELRGLAADAQGRLNLPAITLAAGSSHSDFRMVLV